jgi:hypothetical protein
MTNSYEPLAEPETYLDGIGGVEPELDAEDDIDSDLDPELDGSDYDDDPVENEEDELDILNDADDEPEDEDMPQVSATEHRR